jgi:hypothetical protein
MRGRHTAAGLIVICASVVSQTWAGPAITVYNQNFAVVRDTVPLDLKAGTNEVKFTEVTYQLEPDSVILRDPAGKHKLRILEQNYRNDPVSQGLLLSLCEGKTVSFLIKGQNGKEDTVVQGKVIRSGYLPPIQQSPRYGQEYYYQQQVREQMGQPIIEVDGKLQFALPGLPLFADLSDKTVLKPTLSWLIETDQPGTFDAELAYVTAGMTWEADYNIVAPETGDVMDLIGWVTIDNRSGKAFENAKIKLMAGDVHKIQPPDAYAAMGAELGKAREMGPTVTEKAFEEYHLYTLARPTTLLDRQTKQVEFVRAAGVKSSTIYVYDGAKIDWRRWRGYPMENIRQDPSYGTECNPKVWVMREFANSEENHLGMPLPKGRVRFYRQDTDGQLEFTGENTIDHTPKDERVRVYTGNAFDLVGERRRTDFRRDDGRGPARPGMQPVNNWLTESFEIKVRNHKKEPVEVRVVEHLYRWTNWEITAKSDDYRKIDSQQIEFPITVPADEEKTVTYTVTYTW